MQVEPLVVEASIRSMLRGRFSVAAASPTLATDLLFPEEIAYISRAVEKRRAEFGTARVCARRALAELGVPPCSLVPNSDRSPRWPERVVGSISHNPHCCIVAVSNEPSVLGLGLDVESDEALPPDTLPLICTPRERAWLASQAEAERGRMSKILFSAKESIYKCQYPISKTVLEFSDVTLNVDLENDTFEIADIGRPGNSWVGFQAITGRFRRVGGLVLATAVLTGTP